MHVQPSEHVREAVERVTAIYPSDGGLLEAIEETRACLSDLPQEFTFTFHLAPSPAAFDSDQGAVFLGLLRQVEGWVGFCAHAVLYRLLQLLDDVVSGLNEARYLRAASAARSLVEASAFVHHYGLKLAEANQLVAGGPGPADVITGLAKSLQAALEFAQVSRLNWRGFPSGHDEEFFKKYRLPASAIPEIGKLLDGLPQVEPGSAKFWYGLLCDFVHPNAGSHWLLIDEARPSSSSEMTYTLRLDPASEQALLVILHVIAEPVKTAARRVASQGLQLGAHYHRLAEWRRQCEQTRAV